MQTNVQLLKKELLINSRIEEVVCYPQLSRYNELKIASLEQNTETSPYVSQRELITAKDNILTATVITRPDNTV